MSKAGKLELPVISLFSGGFGLDLGFEQAGFTTRVAVEWEKAPCNTISSNRPHVSVINQDITQVSSEEILKRSGLKVGEAALVIGGPPCQPFSILSPKRKGLEDPRGQLLHEFVRVVRDTRPAGFVLENVKGILSANKGIVVDLLMEEFSGLGYTVAFKVLNAVDYGVPQYRERIIMVGSREGKVFQHPAPSYGPSPAEASLLPTLRPYRTVQEVIFGCEGLPNHVVRVHTDAVIQRYLKLQPGERDRIARTDKLILDQPSGTVLVGSTAGGGRPHVHPTLPRVLTVREAARLQTFPDDWVFSGGSTAEYRQVGNAVPPMLAEAVASAIKEQFFDEHLASRNSDYAS